MVLQCTGHLIEFRAKLESGLVTNYLDDFLFLALSLIECNSQIDLFLQMCWELNVPVSQDKTEWASEFIIFLGILLDGRNFCLGIPIDKRDKAIKLLQSMLDWKKATVKELQGLCGYLNFISRAVFPGRTFVRRMYAKYSQVVNLGRTFPMNKEQLKLKQHHHVRLDKEFKSDCKVWLNFLSEDLKTVVCRPMVDLLGSPVINSQEIAFYSNASAARNLGFSCSLDNKWIQGFWHDHFIEREKPSIEFLELFSLVADIMTWCELDQLRNCRITVFCDNMAVVGMINEMSSSCKHCMVLLRIVVLNGLQYNRRLTARFLTSKQNYLADSLSRGQWSRFCKLGPHMNINPDLISPTLWPITRIWNRVF